MPRLTRRAILVSAASALVIAGVVAGIGLVTGGHPAGGSATPTAVAEQRARFTPVTKKQLAALPVASYNAVIAGLVPYASSAVPTSAMRTYTLRADAAVYGAVNGRPVARFPARNFLHEPSAIVAVAFAGNWALVLTPSRQSLPSSDHGAAPAQTAGWIQRSALHAGRVLTSRVEISIAARRLSIVGSTGSTTERFPIGVGASGTPTPSGVLGYIQARYLDPSQGQATYPINLTSLHATAADEPYEGHDGGLIGMHYHAVSTGAVSHGCLRLSPAALQAVDRLPIGTPVLLRP